MIETFSCADKDTLVAYLYDEVDGDARREVERHLRTCVACARETEGLRTVRRDLASWLAPEVSIPSSLRLPPLVDVSPRPAAVLTSPRWSTLQELPGWAKVAAAVLVGAVSVAVANIQVRSTAEGFVVSSGWMAPAGSVDVPPVSRPAGASAEWNRDLAALEQTLRSEIASMQATSAARAQEIGAELAAYRVQRTDSREATRADSGAVDPAAVIKRVEAMIAASEARQEQEMALRLTQADRSWNIRRQTDLTMIDRRIGSLQGRTLAVQAGQQEMMNFVRRVSTTPNQ